MKGIRFIIIAPSYPNRTATTQCISRFIHAIRDYIRENDTKDSVIVVSGNSVFSHDNDFFYRDCEIRHLYRKEKWAKIIRRIPGLQYYLIDPIWQIVQVCSISLKSHLAGLIPVVIDTGSELWKSFELNVAAHLFGAKTIQHRTEKPLALYRTTIDKSFQGRFNRALTKFAYHFVYNSRDALLIETPTLARYYKTLTNPSMRTFIMPTFPDISPVPVESSDTTDFIITYAGGITKTKKDGVDYLVQAAVMLDMPCVTLQIVGNVVDKNYYCSLQKMVPPHCKTKIIFLPNLTREDYERALSVSSIFVLYKEKDFYTNAGMSSKLIEYLKFGKPVVLTKYVNYFPLNMKDGVNCYIINEENSELLMNKLQQILAADNTTKVGIEGKKELDQSLDPKSYINEFYKFLNTILK